MKTIVEEKIISDLREYLEHTDADEIIVRTSNVRGCWHDYVFDADRAGFSIHRFHYSVYEARHEFSECYHLVRKERANS